jgi:hypothetical protein
MDAGLASRIGQDRWRIAAWVVPALLLVAFAHQAVLPLAARLRDAREQLRVLRENTYEPAWLDSTKGALRGDVEALAAFQASRESALNRDSSVQATIDRIRGLAQKSGIEVIKTTPILAKADSLSLLKVRIEGFSRYSGLLGFFATLKTGHPDLFPEEMLIRQGGERANGRLEGHMVLHVYDRRNHGTRQ